MQLSFRRRLTLFFLLIVVLPMVAVAVLVVDVTDESTTGKADARLGAQLESAMSIYQADVANARAAANELARDQRLAEALGGDRSELESAVRGLARDYDVVSLEVLDEDGETLAAVGQGRTFAPFELELTRDDERIGALTVSTTTLNDYIVEVESLTEDVVLAGPDGPIRGTIAADGLDMPQSQQAVDIEIEGETRRAAAAELPGSDGTRVVLIGEREQGGFLASSPRVAAALVLFFAVALIFVAMLTRALQGQVATMLDAARRIGGGDFSRKVPVVGRDEMAGLASEFNKMSDRLSAQMDQLRRQRVEIERSVRRLGEAFASGLDRRALLGIVVETALTACDAEYGLVVLGAGDGTEAESGTATPQIQEVALAAETTALAGRETAEETRGDVHAIAGPLARIGRPEETIGAMTVARAGEPFTDEERDTFRYLIGQASASVENVALHELVSEQAVTDELTGLSNTRAFRDAIDKEAARAERFGHDLSLLMLDIDDFKFVNDTHGHLQGDEILRLVGRILSSESRGVDEAARYGGEEFVVALPETDAEGAVELGERIRSRLEAERIPLINGGGSIQVTASLGAATLPGSAGDVQGLIAAADEALYAAKRAGKNRVEAAQGRASARRT